MDVAGELLMHQLYLAGMVLVLNAVVHDLESLFAIMESVFDQLPQVPGRDLVVGQKIGDGIMGATGLSVEMLGKVGAGEVAFCGYQERDILLTSHNNSISRRSSESPNDIRMSLLSHVPDAPALRGQRWLGFWLGALRP